jgi:pimeloyl-ACP methyl ester carboxylesterase
MLVGYGSAGKLCNFNGRFGALVLATLPAVGTRGGRNSEGPRIGTCLSDMPVEFRDLGEAESYFREVLAPFGELADEHWMQITWHSVAWDASRERYFMLCDPRIARAFRNPWHYSLDLWKYWTAIKVPILVLRGADPPENRRAT